MMRGRGYGRNQMNAGAPFQTGDGEKIEKKGDVGQVDSAQESQQRSWLNLVTAGAQLTLDIIRVIRGAGDFYRKVKHGA